MIEDLYARETVKKIEKFKVKGDAVLLALDKREKKTEGGIIIHVGESREAQACERGRIVGMGADAFRDLVESEKYKIGATVVITRYQGKHLGFTEDGLELVKVIDTDIHAEVIE